ncbi:8297_t:CDS:2 [Diversispora eburnea]|uniref:8297_t:CDS:1 n=1 Tax=Diversispora eburnea TaxID=1213867 RepID=A0A9N9FJ35_9GLOM|nr:8297_t:CDS:2 [Diversispora eburnea]
MSFSNNKKDLIRITEDRKFQKFDYDTFEDIELIMRGGFGAVDWAYSKDLKNYAALKYLYDENKNNFYKELQNVNGLNHHKNIIKYYESVSHSKKVLVHDGRLLITDLSLSQPLDTNSNSLTRGTFAYTDSEYLRYHIIPSKAKTNYRKYCDSFSIRKTYSNENNQSIQIEVYVDNQLNESKSMVPYNRDSRSVMQIESNNQISFETSIGQVNLEITVFSVLGNPWESSTLSLNSYDQGWLNNELENMDIIERIHNVTSMNDKTNMTLKSIIVNSVELFELFVNEGNRKIPIQETPQIYVKIYLSRLLESRPGSKYLEHVAIVDSSSIINYHQLHTNSRHGSNILKISAISRPETEEATKPRVT